MSNDISIIISLEKKYIEKIIKGTKKTENRTWIPKLWHQGDYYTDRWVFPEKMFVVVKGQKQIDYVLTVNKPLFKDGEYKYPIKHCQRIATYNFTKKPEVLPPQKFRYLDTFTEFLMEQFAREQIF